MSDKDSFMPPNFPKIHAFLEDRLGTSDVSLRFGHVQRGILQIWSNESGGSKSESAVLHKPESPRNEFSTSQLFKRISRRGPCYWLASGLKAHGWCENQAIPKPIYDHDMLGVTRGYGWAFSKTFHERYLNGVVFHDSFNQHDAMMAHEGCHAAIYRSGVLDAMGDEERDVIGEAVAMKLTLEFLKRHGRKDTGSISRYLDLIDVQLKSFDRTYASAAEMTLTNSPQIEANITEVSRANRRLSR